MHQALLRIGPHVIAAGAGLALGLLLARNSGRVPDAPLTVATPAVALEFSAPSIHLPAPQGTAKERIALVFSLGGKQPGQARDAELYQAILALAPEDFPAAAAELPQRLAAYGRGQVGQNKAGLLIEAFMDRWLTLDAPGALRYLAASDLLARIGYAGEKSGLFANPTEVTAAAFRPLARHAPQWTHDWIAAQKPGPERDDAIRTLLDEVARRDTAQAQRFFASFAEGPNRASALQGLVAGMTEIDPRASFDLAMAEPGSNLRDQLLHSVMRGAARLGPALAQELLRRIDRADDRFPAAKLALENLRPAAGDDLLPWIQEESRQVKEFSAYWLYDEWARGVAAMVQGDGCATAAEWAATLSNDPQRVMLRRLAERWAQQNPAALREWLVRHGATLDAASASALRSPCTRDRRQHRTPKGARLRSRELARARCHRERSVAESRAFDPRGVGSGVDLRKAHAGEVRLCMQQDRERGRWPR